MMIGKRLRTACSAGAIVLLSTLGGSVAFADTFTSSLSYTNDTGAPSGPYGSVVVTLTSSTTATIQFTPASGFSFNDGSTVDANGNFALTPIASLPTGVTSNIVGTGCSTCTYSTGSGNVDGIGSFTVEVDTSNTGTQGPPVVSGVTLYVTDSGTPWTSASQVLIGNGPNGTGYDAGAHVYTNANGNTFYAGEPAGSGTPSSVPEPSSVLLLGSSIIGVGAMLRRRQNRTAA